MTAQRSKLYTRTGDDGTTGLYGGGRVGKDAQRVQAIGDLDELNCQLGLLSELCQDPAIVELLARIQGLLFELGAELAQPGSARLAPDHVERLEQEIDRLDASLPTLGSFVLPGGAPAAAHCHLARAVCRRAERSLFRLAAAEQVNSTSLKFVNRLSDLLFATARALNQRAGRAETPWKPNDEARR